MKFPFLFVDHTILVGKSKSGGPVFLCIDSTFQKESNGQPVKVLARTKKVKFLRTCCNE